MATFYSPFGRYNFTLLFIDSVLGNLFILKHKSILMRREKSSICITYIETNTSSHV